MTSRIQQKKKGYCPECAKLDKEKAKEKPWYKERLFQVTAFILILFLLNFLLTPIGITVLQPLFHALYDYTLLIWWAILLGVAIGGVIDYIVPREYISKYLSKSEKKTIAYSVILGFLMSVCSHGILAISMELYKKGASVASVIAFLMASPWANLPITILLVGLFGVNGFYLILSAIVIAVITGIIFQILDRKGWVERSGHTAHTDEGFSVRDDMKRRLDGFIKNPETGRVLKGVLSGSWSLSKMVLWWILIGMVLASAARAYIPQEIFMSYLGPTIFGLLVTMAIATVLEVCSEGTAPLAFEIYEQTGAFGNSFTFLMAGVATDVTELGLIWHTIGRKAALWLPIITVPQILLLGYLFNTLL
jgi:hypothetical protein